jgi:hypothetical protein
MKSPKDWRIWKNLGGVFRRGDLLFLANIPHQIEADWDDVYAPRLAGFPLNLLYTSVRKGEGGTFVASCCYWFDLDTYHEDADKRQITYFPRVKSTYRVEVQYRKRDGLWSTWKYDGEKLVAIAEGPGFDLAMVHTTLVGLQPNEPID